VSRSPTFLPEKTAIRTEPTWNIYRFVPSERHCTVNMCALDEGNRDPPVLLRRVLLLLLLLPPLVLLYVVL
jgi:hypothetical protein